jgi:pimeloyl-ACP methyl ester carboxylesterase
MIYVVFLIFTFAILSFAFYQWQFFMVFSPTYYRSGELGDEFEILSITTEDGVELEGVVYEPQHPRATLLFFAGRSHDGVGLIDRLASFYPDVRIISFNYRSYGRSGGNISEKNLLNDGVHIAKLVQKNYGDFYLLGFSIGSSIVSFVATKVKTKGVFLIGAFDSIISLAKHKYKFVPSQFLRYRFETIKYVKDIDAKTYLFVSRDDEITYIDNARKLKNSIKNLEFYKEFDNLSHKELLWHEDVIEKINGVLA